MIPSGFCLIELVCFHFGWVYKLGDLGRDPYTAENILRTLIGFLKLGPLRPED